MIGTRSRRAVLVGLAFLAGCAGTHVDPSAQQAGVPAIVVAADPGTIPVGGAVALTITASNRTGEVMEFGQGSSSCWFEVRIVDEDSGRTVPFSRACTKDYVTRRLAPGEVHAETVTWRATTRAGDGTVDVRPGAYRITAAAGDHASRPITIQVRE